MRTAAAMRGLAPRRNHASFRENRRDFADIRCRKGSLAPGIEHMFCSSVG